MEVFVVFGLKRMVCLYMGVFEMMWELFLIWLYYFYDILLVWIVVVIFNMLYNIRFKVSGVFVIGCVELLMFLVLIVEGFVIVYWDSEY